ncbi:hypothetical protein SAMN04487980_100924 [Streptomyces sp. cf124]|nr:hypothetical protein SAMN04487980_100924 [Streptomyces sp. cf124]
MGGGMREPAPLSGKHVAVASPSPPGTDEASRAGKSLGTEREPVMRHPTAPASAARHRADLPVRELEAVSDGHGHAPKWANEAQTEGGTPPA